MLLVGYGQSATNYDFFAFNTDGEVWDGNAFVSWVDGSYADYRIAATETGTTGRYTATAPSDVARYEMRFRGASVSASYLVWEETLALNPIIEADQYIDTSTDPWELVYMEKGSGGIGVGTEILRKALYDVDGTGISDATTIIGRQVHV